MRAPALVISHADADGHVIAEHARRNLSLVFDVEIIVDPARTRDHKTWMKLETFPEIERAHVVFFVDLMFAPSSFLSEATALVQFARERPRKNFFVLDHHPLPERLLEACPNVHATYQRDVLDCTYGPSSWLMCIAALLEKQETRADSLVRSEHKILAAGIKRAAALGGPLPGAKLLALLRHNCWPELIALGEDDKENHRLPRGRRPRSWNASGALQNLDELAQRLLVAEEKRPSSKTPARKLMSYDLDIAADLLPSKVVFDTHPPKKAPRQNVKDLEVIVTLLELAAIALTHSPESTFTATELFDEACKLGETTLERADVDLVLEKASFLKRDRKAFRLK